MFANKGVDALITALNAVLRGSLSERCGSINTMCRNYIPLLFATSLFAILAACSSGGDDGNAPFVQESQNSFPFKSLEVDPPADTAAVGTTVQFAATGIKEDNSKETLTTRVSWTIDDETVAQIDAAGVATAITPGRSIITATYSSDGRQLIRSAGITVTSQGLVSINVAAADTTIVAGTSTALTATGNFGDGSTQDISDSVTWQSSNGGVVAVDASNGDAVSANGIAAGSATITAELGGKSDTVSITVTDAVLESIAVTPLTATIVAGSQRQFTATGSYSDGSTQALNANASWQSSNTNVAGVSDDAADGGLATAAEAGETTISATLNGISGSAELTVTAAELVSIAVTPADTTIAAGTDQQFTAVGRFNDNSTQDLTDAAVWSSSNENVAAISNADGRQGLATSRRQGPTTITASMNGVSGSTELTVGPQTLLSIDVTPTNPTAVAGTTQQFTATGNYSNGSTQDLSSDVSWQSSNGAIAAINGSGLATADGAGSSTITASMDGISGDTTLTVTVAELRSLQITPDAPTVTLGDSRQLTATGTYSDNSTQDLTATVTWGPTNSNIASVSNAEDSAGLATARSLGTVTVTATSGELSDDTELTVVDRTLESLTVTPNNSTQAVGGQQQFIATGNYNVGESEVLTSAVDWSSTDTAIATIDNAAGREGLANALTEGTTTIEARLDGTVGSTDFNVIPATLESLSIAPTEATVADGETQQFTATGNYSAGEPRDITALVTWTALNDNVASISNASDSAGLATAIGEGQSDITATSGDVQDTASLTIGPRQLQGIAIAPQNASVVGDIENDNNCLQFTATGSYSNGDNENLTASVSWSSSNVQVASFPSADDNGGALFGLACGGSVSANTDVTVTAAFEGFEDSTNLTVTTPPPIDRVLDGITIAPDNAAIGVGDTLQYSAEGIYSNGDIEAIAAADVSWSVISDDQAASISNGGGDEGPAGEALGTGVGDATINAEYQGFTDDTNLTVNAQPEPEPTLREVTISAESDTILVGESQRYSAIAVYSDGSSEELAATDVAWTAESVDSDDQIASISNDGDSAGEAFGLNAGQATIRGQFEGVTGDATLTVEPELIPEPTLSEVTISAESDTIFIGESQRYSAIAVYSDGSSEVLAATDVAWTAESVDSDDPIASISNDVDTAGEAIGLNAGQATIRGEFEGVTGEATLTVEPEPTPEPTLSEVTIAAERDTIIVGESEQYSAVALYDDGSSINLAATDVTWTAENIDSGEQVASISSTGEALGLSAGQATIRGVFEDVTGDATLTVNPETPVEPTLSGIRIEPRDATISVGDNQPYTVQAIYSDESREEIASDAVSWSSSDFAVGEFVDSAGNLNARNPGTAIISASLETEGDPLVDSTGLTVEGTQADLTSTLEITESVIDANGNTVLSVRVVVRNQGSVAADIFKVAVEYTTANGPFVVPFTVSGENDTTYPFSSDLLAADSTETFNGTVVIDGVVTETNNTLRATADSCSGEEDLSDPPCRVDESNEGNNTSSEVLVPVPEPVLQSIRIDYEPATPFAGDPSRDTILLTATGNYSDETSANITSDVTWVSDQPEIVEIGDDVVEGKRQATALNRGTATIRATHESLETPATVDIVVDGLI